MLRHSGIAIVALVVSTLGTVELGYTAEVFFSIKEYGAVGDGQAKDTAAIQNAIDAAAKAGGGTVYFPAGSYVSGTLYLRSHVTLRLEVGATLLGSKDLEDYPRNVPGFRSYTDNYVNQSLLSGDNLHDIAIVGRGVIDGQGAAFKWKKYENRPYLIRFVSCQNILIEGIHLRNSAMWMQHYLACDNVTIRGISVENHCNYNNDGVDIDCSRNVRIADCIFDSDDDALCLKSTAGLPCENVTIVNCVLSSHCNAIKMGTETNGGFKNITIMNCTIRAPRDNNVLYGTTRGLAGIALEIVDGGTMDRVTISNIAMTGVTSPLFLRLGNRARPFKKDMPKPEIGTFRNVNISNIVATNASKMGCSITGLPGHPIESVALSNIKITFEGGGTKEDASRAIPENPEKYPECTMFGILPSYGFYCRHVEGLSLSHVDVGWENADQRPALVCDDVRDFELNGFNVRSVDDTCPLIVLNNVQGALIRGSCPPPDTGVFLRLQGKTNKVSVMSNDLSQAATAFQFDETTPKTALYQSANRLGE